MVEKKKVVFGATAAIAASISVILGGIYEDEGGYVNHPKDPGGETNYGVTKRVAQEAGWKKAMRAFPKQCEEKTDVCADRIYYENYMLRPGYIPIIEADPAVAEELVNTAVNTGPAMPSRWFQRSLNDICGTKLKVDGRVGPGTVSAFKSCQISYGKKKLCIAMIKALDDQQLEYYRRLVSINSNNKIFYRGWVNNRIGNVDLEKCKD